MEKSQKKIPITFDFETILICAERYACGRRTYMPSAVIGYITPFLPDLSNNTLYVFDQDLTDAAHLGGYGDKLIDEPLWLDFHKKVREERQRRGEKPYKSWRDENGT